MTTATRTQQRTRRRRRVRKKITGSADKPRLAVFRSNRHTYAQLIDDANSKTLAAASTLTVPAGDDPKAQAKAVGKALAEAAKAAGIKHATFDRGGFRYHGRVQAVAEGAREGGLEF